MQLALGLRDATTGARADVLVRAGAGSTLGDVAASLLALIGADGDAADLSADGVPISPDCVLGQAPLVDGALLASRAARVRRHVVDLPSLDVVGGPCAGASHPLTAGHHAIGRTGPLALDDPAISRAHCRLTLSQDGATVHDLGATNGTWVDGVRVGSVGAPLPYGALLRVGASVLCLRPASPPVSPLRPSGDGGLAFNRPPRVLSARPVPLVVLPGAPSEPERTPVPLPAVLAPLVLGVVMWRVLGSTSFLLLTLLSPVLVLGNVLTERRSGHRRYRRERARWRVERDVAERALREAVRGDEIQRRHDAPDPAALAATARARTSGLWERRRADPDALLLRLGLADLPARLEVAGDVPEGATTARCVPVTVSLGEVGVLGIAGPAGQRRALARWLVAQAAALHSPQDLQVVIVTDAVAQQEWDWTRVLPHLRPGADQDCRATLGLGPSQARRRIVELHAALDGSDGSDGSDHRPRVLLVIDGARALRRVPALASVLRDGPAGGITVVALDDDVASLPAECGGTAVLDGAFLTLEVRAGTPVTALTDQVDEAWADGLARALAPLRDGSRGPSGSTALPASARWSDVADLPLHGDEQDVAALLARWSTRSRGTRVPLGIGPAGVCAVDLATDGPHALVAGTTGAGKSELLQTLIASLVAGNRPDDLHLLLVDYKGGAAFGPCADLPHTVGMVTDLDGALVARALSSLTAELKRREAVLAEVGAKDLADLRGQGRSLARLVLVVDEFAALAEELPEFVQGLVGIAQRGRSLGVHLVLATQRPEGVVSADIRANTNLRLCLAVARDTESRDVIDSPLAATISRTTPGRGFLRTGHGELTPFQAGRVGGRRPLVTERPPAEVQLVPTADLGEPIPVTQSGSDDGVSDLSLLVRASRGAAQRLRIPAQPSPWLPPLPSTALREHLPATRPSLLPMGLVDEPASQSRSTYGLDLETGTHLLVVGAPRSGRTTALLALAGSVALKTAPDDLHLYALDLGGGLGALAALPHAGAVVPREQPERMGRVLDVLASEVDRRQGAFAAAGHSSLLEQRAASSGDPLPHLLLVIDRWEAFVAAFQDVDAGRLVDVAYRLLREGPGVGLHVVLTSDRSALVGRLSAMVEDRLLLRLADPGDYAAAGLAMRNAASNLPPGCGWRLPDGALTQLILLAPDASGPAQAAALRALADRVRAGFRAPRRVAPLPTSVSLSSLSRSIGPVIGVGGDELAPQSVDLDDGGFLVAGPPRSGRSTALLSLVTQLDLPVVPIAPRPSPLRGLPGCLTDVSDVPALEDRIGSGPVAVVVDDAELVVDAPLGAALERIVRSARDTGCLVLAAGTIDLLLTGYRGFVVDLRRLRSGLLLCPRSAADGDLLGVRVTRRGDAVVPGRGLLVGRAGEIPVQVALPG